MRSRPGRRVAADASRDPAPLEAATRGSRSANPGDPPPPRRRSRSDSNALRLAALGLLVAIIALALGLRAALAPPDTSAAACRALAWDSVPQASTLPHGWTIADSAFTGTGVTSTLSGPQPTDGSGGSSSVFATVDCFGGDASEVVTRSLAAANAAGQTVQTISGLGDEAYSATDAASGAMAIHFRRGTLVAYAAAVGSTSAADLRAIAAAFDDAMTVALAGGVPPAGAAVQPSPGGSVVSLGSPSPSEGALLSPGPSSPAAASPASSGSAPELEALLPSSVGGTTLTRDSVVGLDALGSDQLVRGFGAALRSVGADPAKLHVAEAYDNSGAIDLQMLAFGMAGLDTTQLEATIVKAWLLADVPGVTTTTVTLSGRRATAVNYGDQGTISYVLVVGAAVVVIETADQTLATQAVAGLG